ncbi:MAG: hypothetical protein ACW991_08925 [Candidatus Hodarchaeales archaeon]|jgi:hypothetical protein
MFETESDDLRTIKAMPFWMGFLAAVIAPVLIAIVFGLLNSGENPLLLQLELMLVAIAFCLTGILARSKLLGLLSIVAAPISWVILFFLEMFTSGFILNPFGIFSGITGPVSSIAESGLIPQLAAYLDLVTQLAIILDLIFVEILAIFLGFFLSTLATGIWTKKGELSIFSCIMKPIAAIFTIIILITVPIAYHAVSNSLYGVISLGAGAAEFGDVFGADLGFGGGSGAQTGFAIDFNNETLMKELANASQRAADWFRESADAFDHVQGNFIATILVDYLLSQYGMENALIVLDFPEILASIATEVPDLMAGYQGLVQGFELTFGVLQGTDLGGGFGGSVNKIDASYNDTFNDGLNMISNALVNFSNAEEGVKDALSKSEDILSELNVGESGDLENIAKIIQEAQIGYGIILDVAVGGIFFLNATYKTTLAIEDLGDVDYVGAHDWMEEASEDLTDANETLRAIDTEDLEEGILPFWGTVEIITDMTELLTYFARAATNGTECYIEIEDIVVAINAIDFEGEDLASISSDLDDLSSQVTEARMLFDGARYNIENATDLSGTFVDKTYGDIIDGSLKPTLIEFSSMLDQFETNVTEISHLLTALDYTLLSAYSFTEGLNLFNSTYNTLRASAGTNGTLFFETFSVDPDIDRSIAYMDYAIDNATDGYDEIELTSVIPSDITIAWKDTLHYPWPPDEPDSELTAPVKSIAGLASGAKGAISALKAATAFLAQEASFELINDLFDSMDEVGFEQIFGGG